MHNKGSKDVNGIVGKIIFTLLWVVFTALIVNAAIMWAISNDSIAITSGIIGAGGVLFNIYLMSREKKISKQG